MKNRLLALAIIAEVATGLTLLLVPSLVDWQLLGTELSEISVSLFRGRQLCCMQFWRLRTGSVHRVV
jgi:hypothetical protein